MSVYKAFQKIHLQMLSFNPKPKPKFFKMKRAILLITFVAFSVFKTFGQDSTQTKKTNPIIYAEFLFGYARTDVDNFEFGSAVNYQSKKSLFTARATANIPASDILFNPNSYVEYAVLYGRRFIHSGHSLSYSAGISWNKKDFYSEGINYGYHSNYHFDKKEIFLGLPFEFNVQWFDAKKEKYRVLGIFPVGKPFAFGGGGGFKIQGNVSKHSYVALGLVLGFGFYKHY